MIEGTQVAIIDFGGQLVQCIRRLLCGEFKVDSVILKPEETEHWLSENMPKCIIFSGGPASVYHEEAPMPPESLFSLGVPILGICYGMQVLAKRFGGIINSQNGNKHYGRTEIIHLRHLISGERHLSHEQEPVFASHGDFVSTAPADFMITAVFTDSNGIAAMGDPVRKIWGVQYHPEAVQTQRGTQLFKEFLFDVSDCRQDYHAEYVLERIEQRMRELAGRRTVIGFSGGVDSSVTAALALRFLPAKDVLGVCIDTGGLRDGEVEEVRWKAASIGLSLVVVPAAEKFMRALSGSVDAEERRHAFKNAYHPLFLEEASRFGADAIIHGGIAPDFIETTDAGNVIKTHHNIHASYIQPLKELFKFEVRALGRQLGLRPEITECPPFPGPGLYIRIINTPVTMQNMHLLRCIDADLRRILQKYDHGLPYPKKISQAVIALICVPTTGIKGDKRVYTNMVAVRPVFTPDFMTAEPYYLPEEVVQKMACVATQYDGINRLVVDYTDKPSATIEYM